MVDKWKMVRVTMLKRGDILRTGEGYTWMDGSSVRHARRDGETMVITTDGGDLRFPWTKLVAVWVFKRGFDLPKSCPRCGDVAHSESEIGRLFGWRRTGKSERPNSHCKGCKHG